MGYLEDLKFGYKIMTAPASASKRKLEAMQMLAMYYKLSIPALILYIIVAFISGNILPHPYLTSAGTYFMPMIHAGPYPGIAIAYAILFFWVLVPISIAVNALIFHVVGKHFLNVWKGRYEETFNAVAASAIPSTWLYWLFPIVSGLYLVVATVWQLVVLVISLSARHKVSRLQAIGSVAVSVILVMVVAMLAIVGFAMSTGIYNSGMMYRWW